MNSADEGHADAAYGSVPDKFAMFARSDCKTCKADDVRTTEFDQAPGSPGFTEPQLQSSVMQLAQESMVCSQTAAARNVHLYYVGD
jgi:hypothetical protein